MSDLESWFNKEVYGPRVVSYLCLSQLSLLSSLFLYSGLLRTVTSIPGFYLPDAQTAWVHAGGLSHYVLLALSTFLLWLLHLYNLSVESQLPTRRIMWLTNWVYPGRLLHLGTLGLSGALSSHCFLVLALGSSPWLRASGGLWHWNERHWFVVGAGAFAGLLYGLHYYSNEQSLVKFPIVQCSKSRVIKSGLVRNLLPQSLTRPVKYLLWYYLLYWVYLRSILEEKIPRYFDVVPGGSRQLSWGGMLEPSLLATVWVTSSFLYWLWGSLVVLARAIFSQRHQFTVSVTYEANQLYILQNCLTAKNVYLKYLAFLDLKTLAQSSLERRKEVFLISTAGGSPRHWPPISAACLSVIQDFLKMLEGPSSTPPKKELYTPADLPSPHPGMRRIMVCNSPPSVGPSQAPSIMDVLQTQVLTWWSSRPTVKFILSELPEANTRRAFALCQPVVWAVEALCFLLAASPQEDRFGVVQTSIPDVISSLIQLQMAVDKTTGLRTSNVTSQDIQLRRSLKFSLSLGLHHLTQAFGKNLLSGVGLSEEHKKYLEQFLNL